MQCTMYLGIAGYCILNECFKWHANGVQQWIRYGKAMQTKFTLESRARQQIHTLTRSIDRAAQTCGPEHKEEQRNTGPLNQTL